MFIQGIDEDVETISPQSPDSARLDTAFENFDCGIAESDPDEIVMKLPMGKTAKVSKQRLRSCKTDRELRALDCEIYRLANLNPADYGI